VKITFYGELETAFDKFGKYRTKMLDINAKVGREDIFKPTHSHGHLLLEDLQ
jgi:hypothetical protein